MWIYLYFALAITVAYLVGKNSNKTGYGFWRSFIFILVLFAVVLAFLSKQLGVRQISLFVKSSIFKKKNDRARVSLIDF